MVREFALAPSEAKNRTSFYTNQKNVTTAGTAVQCPTQVVPDGFEVVIKAKAANTGTILVGNSQANAQNTNVAFKLTSNQSTRFKVSNTDLIWIDSTVNGEGVEITVET